MTKRYHLTDDISLKTRLYLDKCMELERHLQLSVTPKSQLIEDHSCQQQVLFCGIDDPKESFGERNHHYETRADI